MDKQDSVVYEGMGLSMPEPFNKTDGTTQSDDRLRRVVGSDSGSGSGSYGGGSGRWWSVVMV